MSLRRDTVLCAVMAALACGKSAPPPDQTETSTATPPDQEPPVAVNPDSPIQYPPRLYDQKVEGDVVLRLYVDSGGRLVPESSRVAETSGYPALDSAALSGARRLRFAPARRRGTAVATAFLQPIEFRHPGAGATVIKGRPDTTPVIKRSEVTPALPRPDTVPTVRVRRDTFPPPSRPDTTRARPDTAPRDTNAARADTSARAP